jgi:acyl-CoA thioester hydrolase
MDLHRTSVRVRYAETDQMGVVYHANYYVWMEVARVELCDSLGFRYRDMEKDGVMMAVVESTCRYVGAARFDDTVVIESRVAEANSRSVLFTYDLSVDGRPIASGTTRHLYLNSEFRPIRLPARYHSLFGLK